MSFSDLKIENFVAVKRPPFWISPKVDFHNSATPRTTVHQRV